MFVVSVSGLDANQRSSVHDFLIDFDTKIRPLMRRNGVAHLEETLCDLFYRVCKGVLATRECEAKYGNMVGHIPWVVCLGYAPMSDPSRLRGARFWDTGCSLNDMRISSM